MQRNEIIATLTDPGSQQILDEYSGMAVDALIFRKKFGSDEHVQELIKILHLYHKARLKLPSWVDARCAFDARGYEQASSEQTAFFKASLFSGNRLLNLTGGIGVDDFAFANSFKEVISVDIDPDVHQMAEYNMSRLGRSNVKRIRASAEEILSEAGPTYDLIYIDPDRRPGDERRVVSLNDTVPPVLELEKEIFAKAPICLIKLSPLYDLSQLERELQNLSEIYVVSVHHEVKEILAVSRRENNGTIKRVAVDLNRDGSAIRFTTEGQKRRQLSNSEQTYLYEAGVAVVKAELTEDLFDALEIDLLDIRSPYGVRDGKLDAFLGKIYTVLWEMPVKWRAIKKRLKDEGIREGFVSSKGFHLKPSQIQKKLNFSEGGIHQLIFTNQNEKPRVYCCVRAD